MADDEQSKLTVLAFSGIAKLAAVFGLAGGILSVLIFLVAQGGTADTFEIVTVALVVPPCFMLYSIFYALLGYPLYVNLARRNLLGFGDLPTRE